MILKEDVELKSVSNDVLVGSLYRAKTSEKLPTLLFRTPYGKEIAQTYFFNNPFWFVERGFVVFIQDVRGRGGSRGNFEPIINEATDGEIAANWILNQNWSNQKILGLGYSYCGLNQFLAQKKSGLFTAISPALYFNNLFDGCLRQNQTVAMSFLLSWAQALGGTSLDYLDKSSLNKIVLNNSLKDLYKISTKPWFSKWIEVLENSQESSNLIDNQSDIPVLHLGGFYDTFRQTVVDNFNDTIDKSRNIQRLVMGPWSHFPSKQIDNYFLAPNWGKTWSPSENIIEFYNEILTSKELNNSERTIKVCVINDPFLEIHGKKWPPIDYSNYELFLLSSGQANNQTNDGILQDISSDSEPDSLTYDHFDPLIISGGDDCGDATLLELGPKIQNQNELRFNVLTYTSHEFFEDALFVGDSYLDLFYETYDSRSQWFSRICLVTKDGNSINLVDAIITIDNNEVLNRVRLNFGPISFMVKKHERLRIQLSNGAFPRWELLRDREGRPVIQNSRVLHNQAYPSKLTLPKAN